MIYVCAHLVRAARPPCPNRRTNVIDDGNIWCLLAHTPRHTMGEFRAIDDDQDVRIRRYDRIGSLPDAVQNFRQACRDCGKPDDREISERKEAWDAFGRHM